MSSNQDKLLTEAERESNAQVERKELLDMTGYTLAGLLAGNCDPAAAVSNASAAIAEVNAQCFKFTVHQFSLGDEVKIGDHRRPATGIIHRILIGDRYEVKCTDEICNGEIKTFYVSEITPLLTPHEFKVGERVEVVTEMLPTFIGKVGTVNSVDRRWVEVNLDDDISNGRSFEATSLTHLPSNPAQDVNAQLLEVCETTVRLLTHGGISTTCSEDHVLHLLRTAIAAAKEVQG